jgi:hypothetical protein
MTATISVTTASSRAFRQVAGVCLIVGPLLAVIVTVFHPQTVNDGARQMAIVMQYRDRWNWVHQLLFFDQIVMVPAILGLMALLQDRWPRFALLAGLVSMVGILGGAGSATDELIVGEMAAMRGAEATMIDLFNRVHGAGGFFIFLLAAWLPLGLLLFAWGLARSRRIHPLVAVVLGVGAVLEFVGLPTTLAPVTLTGHTLEFLALSWIGIGLLGLRRAQSA